MKVEAGTGVRAQWAALPLVVRFTLVGLAIGLVVGTGLIAMTVPSYLRADPDAYPPRTEILEGGVLMAPAIGMPSSILLLPLMYFGLLGWVVYIFLAPTVNFGLIAAAVGGVALIAKRRAAELAEQRKDRG